MVYQWCINAVSFKRFWENEDCAFSRAVHGPEAAFPCSPRRCCPCSPCVCCPCSQSVFCPCSPIVCCPCSPCCCYPCAPCSTVVSPRFLDLIREMSSKQTIIHLLTVLCCAVLCSKTLSVPYPPHVSKN